jgi:hypothetical protein
VGKLFSNFIYCKVFLVYLILHLKITSLGATSKARLPDMPGRYLSFTTVNARAYLRDP